MGTPYDHEIMIGSTVTKLRLVRDDNDRAMYSVTEDVPNYAAQITAAQKNWQNGHGQYEFADPEAYFEGQSIDTTQEGRVILAPLISEVKEAATKREFYSSGDVSYTNFTETAWRAQTFTPAVGHVIGRVKLRLHRLAGTTPGTITVSIRATDGSGFPTGADLCSGTYDGNTLTTDDAGAWYEIVFTTNYTLTVSTKYAIVIRAGAGTPRWRVDNTSATYAGGEYLHSADSGGTWAVEAGGVVVDTMFEEWTPAATELDTTPVVFLWAASMEKFLCATSGKIYIYDVGWTAATTTVAGVTDLKEYNGIAYAAVGASTLYYYSSDGDTWTQTDLTDGYANKFLVAPNAAGTANVLWKFKTSNEISSTTDGRTVAAGGVQWTSAAYVGDTSTNITNLFLFNDELMVGRLDNLYNYDNAGGVHALMDELKQARSTKNFEYVANWQSGVYFSLGTGVGELIGSSPGLFSQVSPLAETGDIDKVGICVGITADPDWLYVAMLENTVIHIYKGRQTSTSRGLVWQWCPFVYVGTNNCTTIAIAQHSATDRRLWFGYGTHTAYVTLVDNPTTDATARFAASGWVRMSYIYGSNPFWDKLFQSVVTETKGCTANITVQPKYRKDTDTSATNLTAAITTNGVVKTNLTTALTCNRIQFELHLATNDSTITPEVLTFIARGTERPETIRVHDCTYSLGDRPTNRVEALRTTLRGGRTTTNLIKFADYRYGDDTGGTNYVWVVMQPGFPKEVEIKHEKQRQPELGVQVRWQEVSFTIS